METPTRPTSMQPIWLSEKVYFSGDDYFQAMLSDIDRAAQLITLEMYIFNNDVIGQKILTHLCAAQKRGVRVEMIIDGVGSMPFPEGLAVSLRQQGIRFRTYNPLPFWHPLYGNLSLTRKLQIYGLRFTKLNKRNHRKIVTIDESIMYTGSFNITVEHTSLYGTPWKDMGVRVTGSLVKFAVLNFKRHWKLREFYRYRKLNRDILKFNWRQSPLRLNQTILMKRFYQKDFYLRISKAREKIWLITPYFIPPRRLIRSLAKAAKRGVDVCIVTSERTDVTLFRTLQYFYYPYLLKKGVRVFQYNETILHAKNYIIDDWTTIGTTNLNHRSFKHDLEADLEIQDKKNIEAIENNFRQLVFGLRLLSQEELKSRPWPDKIMCRLFFLFKYWF
jgi:cardiolipin synthase A/B